MFTVSLSSPPFVKDVLCHRAPLFLYAFWLGACLYVTQKHGKRAKWRWAWRQARSKSKTPRTGHKLRPLSPPVLSLSLSLLSLSLSFFSLSLSLSRFPLSLSISLHAYIYTYIYISLSLSLPTPLPLSLSLSVSFPLPLSLYVWGSYIYTHIHTYIPVGYFLVRIFPSPLLMIIPGPCHFCTIKIGVVGVAVSSFKPKSKLIPVHIKNPAFWWILGSCFSLFI